MLEMIKVAPIWIPLATGQSCEPATQLVLCQFELSSTLLYSLSDRIHLPVRCSQPSWSWRHPHLPVWCVVGQLSQGADTIMTELSVVCGILLSSHLVRLEQTVKD